MPNIFSLTGQLSALSAAIEKPNDGTLTLTERGLAVQRGNNTRFGPLRAARAAAVIEYLADHQPASRSEIAKHVGCAPDTLTHILRVMAEAKQIRSIGICKGARWALYTYRDNRARLAA